MSSDRTEEFSTPSGSSNPQMPDDGGHNETRINHEATIAVRGEMITDKDSKSDKDQKSEKSEGDRKADKDAGPAEKPKSAPKEVTEAKAGMQRRLPALDDDADVGIQKEQIVTRDGKADLAFTGTLLASAAPDTAPDGHWQEYRVYETNGGKYVFSKVKRTVFVKEHDTYEAEVFDPAPSSTTSQLLRSAREITRSRPLTWTDAAVAFFGYDPLAKVLYRKLSGRFEEHIS